MSLSLIHDDIVSTERVVCEGNVLSPDIVSGAERGHVQPWMIVKVNQAARDAVTRAFIEIDAAILKKKVNSTYLALHQNRHPEAYLENHSSWSDPITNPCLDIFADPILCLCKDSQANHIIKEEVSNLHYHLWRGWTPLLKEPNALHNAKDRAWQRMMRAGQDAKRAIVESGDQLQSCCGNDDVHMRAWMK